MKKAYNEFDFRDFIQDTAFIQAVLQHPEGSEAFRIETGCVENRDEMEKAWKYVKDNGLSQDEADALWIGIAQDTFQKEDAHAIQRRCFPWRKIAAFLIVACCSAAFLYYIKEKDGEYTEAGNVSVSGSTLTFKNLISPRNCFLIFFGTL